VIDPLGARLTHSRIPPCVAGRNLQFFLPLTIDSHDTLDGFTRFPVGRGQQSQSRWRGTYQVKDRRGVWIPRVLVAHRHQRLPRTPRRRFLWVSSTR
jgi:hypothetical protein